MNKIIRFIQNYLIAGFFLVIALFAWTYIDNTPQTNMIAKVLQELLSYNLMLWFLTIIFFMFLLVVVPRARDKTFRWLANLQERDEREAYITGKAARASYLATLSLSLFLLFFSLFSFNVSKIPNDSAKFHGTANISVSYHFFRNADPRTPEEKTHTIFDSRDFSLSNSTVIMGLLLWQLVTFNLAARRERDL